MNLCHIQHKTFKMCIVFSFYMQIFGRFIEYFVVYGVQLTSNYPQVIPTAEGHSEYIMTETIICFKKKNQRHTRGGKSLTLSHMLVLTVQHVISSENILCQQMCQKEITTLRPTSALPFRKGEPLKLLNAWITGLLPVQYYIILTTQMILKYITKEMMWKAVYSILRLSSTWHGICR